VIRSGKPLWAVRLLFVGDPLRIDGDLVGGGFTVRYVRADDGRGARHVALREAKAALADLKPVPEGAVVFWSTESVEKASEADATEFYLFDEESRIRPKAIRTLVEELAEKDLRLEIAASGVVVVAEGEDRTTVGISYEETTYEVFSRPWHAHFQDAEQAVACFRWLLTPFYRIGIDRQGDRVAAAWIERYLDDGWEPLHPVLFRNPTDPTAWMGGWTREYRQQAAVEIPVPYDEIVPGAKLDDRGFPLGTILGKKETRVDRPLAEELGWLEEDQTFDPGSVHPPPGFE